MYKNFFKTLISIYSKIIGKNFSISNNYPVSVLIFIGHFIFIKHFCKINSKSQNKYSFDK